MPATKDQISKSITPGSMDYGARSSFNAALSGGAAPPSGAAAPPDAGVAPGAADPLGMLLGGALGPPGSEPVTSGLSVGPGPGAAQGSVTPDDISERLRLVAQNAKTPMMRAMARAALRRRIQETKGF